MMIVRAVAFVFRNASAKFLRDNASQMSAALSYYALFAIPPLFFVILNILSMVLIDQNASEATILFSAAILGDEASPVVTPIFRFISSQKNHISITGGMSVVLLLIAAAGIVTHMQSSLDHIWGHEHPHKGRFLHGVKQRLLGTIVLLFGCVYFCLALIGDLSLQIFIATMTTYYDSPQYVVTVGHTLVSFGMIVVLLALIYKYVPSAWMSWRDVTIGACISAFLLLLGRVFIGWYITIVDLGTFYGATNSILILLVWMYYSSLIFFFGAEVTQAFAQLYGHGISSRHKEENTT